MMFGGNDGQRIEPYPGSGGHRIKWKYEAEWRAEYTRRVRTLARILGGGGARVFIISYKPPFSKGSRTDATHYGVSARCGG